MKFIDINTEYKKFQRDIDQSISRVLKKSNFILGSEVKQLENKLKNFTGSKYCITTSSGTDGLLLALKSLNLKQNDEIIIPDFAYVSPAEVAAVLNLKIKFVDVDYETFLIDPKKLKKKITNKTKVIVVVSLFGQCPNFTEIIKIIKNKNIILIEDAAQSFGAKYKNKNSCNIADISVTSFFPTKTLGCFGDGGAVFTNNKNIFKKITYLRNHGQTNKKYIHNYVGFNARLDTIQAAVLLIKLNKIKKLLKLRTSKANNYYSKLKNNKKIILPKIKENNFSSFAQFTIKTKFRNRLIEIFKKNKIPFSIYYPKILSEQKAYKQKSKNKISKILSREAISIPFSPWIAIKDQNKVIDAINKL
ncbi:DegT/DnrJ/EryC1/StrS family aminotransferase [Candidatus Pelagibacter communis]|uniref:DegT/DnrJ/EryC1/StrS family aminotransferase n=1 Tax=Pelagibacter ubique TaxID=198252 RepID=UPI00065B3D5A|nr:aminotransferase class V-fold PLP-dependent enzyme [Candidatus Pelagibacter ubique]